MQNLILTATPATEGKKITACFGIVTDEAIIGANGSMLVVSASGTVVFIES